MVFSLTFFETGQIALNSHSILVVGLGGLGCPAATYLAAAGIARLGLVDGDVVEFSNLHRQILHTPDKVGMLKVESAAAYLETYEITISLVSRDVADRGDLQPKPRCSI